MNYLEILKKNNLKATPQRISILKVLKKHEHPNIDELYEQIKKDYPAISLATVYKNLSTMIDGGLVIELSIPNNKSKYDIYEYEHIHLVCNNCLSVQDVDKKEANLEDYQNTLQSKINSEIDNIKIVVFTKNCSNCK